MSELPKLLTPGCCLVTDFNPLRESRAWTEDVLAARRAGGQADAPCFEVDAHNVVPLWEASDKLEYAARTIRPKITREEPFVSGRLTLLFWETLRKPVVEC